jgi:Sulfotransferase family
LWQAWAPHWDLERPVLLEKSPPNLLRTRFLQALFPDSSHFVVVVRHPIAVAYATKRWSRIATWIPPQASRRLHQLQAPLGALLRHWVEAHEQFLADASALENVCLVRYEDLVTDPAGEMQGVFRFLGLEPVSRDWEVKRGLNERYLQRWHARAQSRTGRAYLGRLARDFEDRVRPFGYSLAEPERLLDPQDDVAQYLGHPGLTRSGEA